jgi:hypothetical protein
MYAIFAVFAVRPFMKLLGKDFNITQLIIVREIIEYGFTITALLVKFVYRR